MLRPYPFGALAEHMLRELDAHDSVFGLPRARFWQPDPELDLSVSHHGHRAATPLGPAAGPHTQMAQNIVAAWLAGCRILELKTVQVLDELVIPRPCIDLQTIGYNVEWSQELRLHESLHQYVAASMLITILEARGVVPPTDVRFDMSVGYDLQGIQSPSVAGFLRAMRDATSSVDALRRELPADLADLDFRTDLSDSVTLSTFHGCPPDEIERIVDHLLVQHGLSCTIKLNPTLLGPTECRGLLHDTLGYDDVVPDSAFANDATWDQVVDFSGRLGDTAAEHGLGFGVKFTNTLIVENHRDFFPRSESVMYLSGQPLHVLAMHLVRRFRRTFGDRWPVSFSAGIDANNFADAVALGLVPITVCSDLLRPGGYGRLQRYLEHLTARMREVGASTLDALVATGDLEAYVDGLATDPRYHRDHNSRIPRKVDSHLTLFDCLTCHKCVPVCPNHANFAFAPPPARIVPERLTWDGAAFARSTGDPVELAQPQQFATFADFCNDCGNCDVFCPEHGGPYQVKPHFFGTRADFDRFVDRDGVHVGADAIVGRFDGRTWALHAGTPARFVGPSFEVLVDPDGRADSVVPVHVDEGATVDLGWLHVLQWLRLGVQGGLNLVSSYPEGR